MNSEDYHFAGLKLLCSMASSNWEQEINENWRFDNNNNTKKKKKKKRLRYDFDFDLCEMI